MTLLPMEREFIRLSQERIIELERALDRCHPKDRRRKDELEKRLADEKRKYGERAREYDSYPRVV